MERIFDISICVPTYKHKKWLTKCLESIISQKTKFRFEVLVGIEFDDLESIDYVPINRNHEKANLKYIISSKENLIYINNQRTGRGNFNNLVKEAKGKYIAICEGDDYWIDPYKLEKQVEALEKNPDCVACHTWQKIAIYDPIMKTYIETTAPKENQGYLNCEKASVEEIFRNRLRPKSRTMLYRNVFKEKELPSWFFKVKYGDEAINFFMGTFGDFYFIDKEMAVYRQNLGGASNIFREKLGYIQGTYDWIVEYEEAAKFYDGIYDRQAIEGMFSFMKRLFLKKGINMRDKIRALTWIIFNPKIRILMRIKLFWLLVAFIFSKKTIT